MKIRTQRRGCFVETLACFRVDMEVAAEMAAIQGNDDFYPQGKLSPDYLAGRTMGIATVRADCADICSAECIAKIRQALLPRASELLLKGFRCCWLALLVEVLRVEFVVGLSSYLETAVVIEVRSKAGNNIVHDVPQTR